MHPSSFLVFALLAPVSLGCFAASPTPLAPALRGSVGVPHQGVVTGAVELPRQGDGYRLLRSNGIRWGTPRLVATVQRAARDVASMRPEGEPLIVGDLSARYGGETKGHRSHRTGRDVDLLLFAVTPDGRPVRSPGFVQYGPDGIAKIHEPDGSAGATSGIAAGDYLRVDIEREWLLVKALVTSPEADIQWLFLARWIEALIVEYARARGEDPELVWYAENLLLQPADSTAHADHIHLRIACAPDEQVAGCLGGGPLWPWLPAIPALAPLSDGELAAALLDDLVPGVPTVDPRAAADGAP